MQQDAWQTEGGSIFGLLLNLYQMPGNLQEFSLSHPDLLCISEEQRSERCPLKVRLVLAPMPCVIILDMEVFVAHQPGEGCNGSHQAYVIAGEERLPWMWPEAFTIFTPAAWSTWISSPGNIWLSGCLRSFQCKWTC